MDITSHARVVTVDMRVFLYHHIVVTLVNRNGAVVMPVEKQWFPF